MTTVAPRSGSAQATRAGRLVGVDVARFFAVFGMFCIHFAVPFTTGAVHDRISEFAGGRSTALFTLLAGVSLALMTGRQEPPTGAKLRDARLRVAVRAGILLVVGWILVKATEDTGFLLTVIIPFYGMYFLLSVPFLRMRSRGLITAAVVAVLAGPQLSFVLRGWVESDTPLAGLVAMVNSVDPAHQFADEGIFDLLLLGFYPAMSYMPLVLAGLAVGRMDLRSTATRVWIAAVGLVLALGARWLSKALVITEPPGPNDGTVDVHHPEWLLDASSHSGTSFEIVSAAGVALVALAVCLAVADLAGKWITPLANAGSMALTLYALHVLVMNWQVVVGGWHLCGKPQWMTELATAGPNLPLDDPELPSFPRDASEPEGLARFVNIYIAEIFLIFALAFANLWRRFFRRGPLEAFTSDAVVWCMKRLQPRA
ncbi:acyltransferase family protein [Saccharopolyspora griseoalba]|uniref:Acyltransferase family protein n=1 Tax=Saccharopolyspora griseoalba TaxID=1431848 RepID=A0ABW2LN82_9PSEU